MKMIYKYEVNLGPNEIDLPTEGKVLSFLIQDNEDGSYHPCIWVELDTTKSQENSIKIFLCYTGVSIVGLQSKDKFIATAMSKNGLVFHCYQLMS